MGRKNGQFSYLKNRCELACPDNVAWDKNQVKYPRFLAIFRSKVNEILVYDFKVHSSNVVILIFHF